MIISCLAKALRNEMKESQDLQNEKVKEETESKRKNEEESTRVREEGKPKERERGRKESKR